MSYVFYAYWDWRFVGLMWVSTGIDYLAGRMIVRTVGPEPRAGVPDRRADGEPRDPRLLQVRRLLPRLAGGHRLGPRPGHRPARRQRGAADRDLVLHVQLDVVHDRRLPRRVQAGAERRALRGVRGDVPAPDRGADRPLRRHRVAARAAATAADRRPRRAPASSSSPAGSGRSCCSPTPSRPTVDQLFARHESLGFISAWGAALGYSLQLYFDFSGYSDMAVGLAFLLGFRFPAELQLAVQVGQHLRLLATLAHVAVVLPPRLPVHPPGRLAAAAAPRRCATS